MSDKDMARPADRAGGPSDLSRCESQPTGAHPSRNLCSTCGGESRFDGRCAACILADYEDDYDDECYECGGDGYISSCMSEYACLYPEDGCDLCTRRCDVCTPRTRDSDGSPQGGDGEAGSVQSTTARAEGIAQGEGT